MCEKIKQIAKDTGGSAVPLTIALVLSFVILMCGVSEYFRLQIIASGVKEAVEDTIISTVKDNYAGVYHGVVRDTQADICQTVLRIGKKHLTQEISTPIWTKQLAQSSQEVGVSNMQEMITMQWNLPLTA